MTNNHLADEILSALLDNEDSSDWVTHVSDAHPANCTICTTRLEELRAVSQWVATSLPTTNQQRMEQTIATILSVAASEKPPKSGRKFALRRWMAASAAAAIIAAGVVAIPSLLRNEPPNNQAAMTSTDGTVSQIIDGGHLILDATTDLRIPIQTALAPLPTVAKEQSSAVGDRQLNNSNPASGKITESGSAAESSDKTPTTTPSPVASSPGEAAPPSAGLSIGGSVAEFRYGASEPHARCEPLIRKDDKRLGALLYRASADFTGEQAIVEVFALSPPEGKNAADGGAAKSSLNLRAYVLTASDCRVLNVQSFDFKK
ncbi:MAG: hypothetical protein ACSLFB_06590 [Acidimicrobiales bacterium]